MFGHKNEEQIACQGCGKLFPKSKLKKCKKCGVVLCPKCRKNHQCHTTQSYVSQSSIEIHEEYNSEKWFDSSSRTTNPQCIIKITDMRIYEIANNPKVMTEYEEYLIYSDPDIKRRYDHYRTVIENEGR